MELFVGTVFLTCSAVLERVAMFVIASEWEVCGEESASNRHYNADKDRIPGHIECVTNVLLSEVGHYNVVNKEQCVASCVTEDDRNKERHKCHTETTLEIDLLDFFCDSTDRLKNIELFFSL